MGLPFWEPASNISLTIGVFGGRECLLAMRLKNLRIQFRSPPPLPIFFISGKLQNNETQFDNN